MKRFAYTLMALFAILFTASCSMENAGSSATVSYYTEIDTILYKDSANVEYEKYIIEALGTKGLQKTGLECYFNETAESKQSHAMFAIALCNDQAIKTWEANMSEIRLKDVADAIYKNHSSDLTEMGITNSKELNLKPIRIRAILYSIGSSFTDTQIYKEDFSIE